MAKKSLVVGVLLLASGCAAKTVVAEPETKVAEQPSAQPLAFEPIVLTPRELRAIREAEPTADPNTACPAGKKERQCQALREVRHLLRNVEGISVLPVDDLVVVDGAFTDPRDVDRMEIVDDIYKDIVFDLTTLSPKMLADSVWRMQQAMGEHWVGGHVTVLEQNRTIQLEGEVETEADRQKAQELAETFLPPEQGSASLHQAYLHYGARQWSIRNLVKVKNHGGPWLARGSEQVFFEIEGGSYVYYPEAPRQVARLNTMLKEKPWLRGRLLAAERGGPPEPAPDFTLSSLNRLDERQRQRLQSVRQLTGNIDNVWVEAVGDKIVVDGEFTDVEQSDRLQRLGWAYRADLVNLTRLSPAVYRDAKVQMEKELWRQLPNHRLRLSFQNGTYILVGEASRADAAAAERIVATWLPPTESSYAVNQMRLYYRAKRFTVRNLITTREPASVKKAK